MQFKSTVLVGGCGRADGIDGIGGLLGIDFHQAEGGVAQAAKADGDVCERVLFLVGDAAGDERIRFELEVDVGNRDGGQPLPGERTLGRHAHQKQVGVG